MNLCATTCGANGSVDLGGLHVDLPAGLDGVTEGRRVVVGLRPEALELAPDGLSARVEVVEELGADAYVFCATQLGDGETRLVARTEARRPPERGSRVFLRPLPGEAHVFDADTGERV